MKRSACILALALSLGCTQHLFAQGAGDPVAQHNLGVMYEEGKGVTQDFAQALSYYRKAADQGYAPAQTSLGRMYAAGRGVARDDAQAAMWFRRAAGEAAAPAATASGPVPQTASVAGMPVAVSPGLVLHSYGVAALEDAELLLGPTQRDISGATFQQTKDAAEQGNVVAQYHLGVMHERSIGAPRMDPVQAFSWYRKAADQGYPEAEFTIAEAIDFGRETDLYPKNKEQATEWYRKAADHGFPLAQHRLAKRYDEGNFGVPTDHAAAMMWYRKAAEQGYSPSQTELGHRYRSGFFIQADGPQAVLWYRKAADQGYTRAADYLGLMYEKGIGIPVDLQQAAMWYRKAAADKKYFRADEMEHRARSIEAMLAKP
ncbi:MAG: SEL1-like repeat protein [Alphaproteobacteria bacterium]|nr:SEL1-like repeat protein [Alphaproteobacteria bacterium]